MIRFLHAADLHLGMRTTRFDESACERIGEARYAALQQLRDRAAEHKVDFILIAGDLFDDHSVSRAEADRAYRLLEGSQMPPVYIIPGNHDPLTPGGVWDRDPWLRDQPSKHTFLLREPKPVAVPGLPVTLFPCPCRNRNSFDDPTAWIAAHPRRSDDPSIRIGVAHGSLMIMPNLPEDDHPIPRDAAQRLGLDYLALGHWHKARAFASADGVERTAYSGVHEPMRFPGTAAGVSTGWSSFSADGDAERFHDEGRGTAQLATIVGSGAPPRIEAIETGWLRWLAEEIDLTSVPIGEVISRIAQMPNPAQVILRMRLFGVVEPRIEARIKDELRPILLRFHPGSEIDDREVTPEPSPGELRSVVGDGVLARVLERLREDAHSGDATQKRIAGQALKLLYRIAWEDQAR